MGCVALGAWETILVACLQLVLYAALQVPYPGQVPMHSAHVVHTTFQGVNVATSIQVYAIYILGNAHVGLNSELCLSTYWCLPGRLQYCILCTASDS